MPTIRIDDLPALEQLTPEDREQVLGAGRAMPVRLGLENLECREVPATLSLSSLSLVPKAITPMASAARVGSDLVVTGTNSADNVVVSQSSTGLLSVKVGKTTSLVSSTGVNRIVFQGKAGDDVFINNTKIGSLARGGLGNDTLIGGMGADLLFGDGGMDALSGREGNDTLFASSVAGGQDGVTWGYQGAWNALDGGSGADTIYGSANNDLFSGVEKGDNAFGFGGADLAGKGSSAANAFTTNGATTRAAMFGAASGAAAVPNHNQRLQDGGSSGSSAFSFQDSSTDTQQSNGTQTIERHETYSNGDGSTTVIRTTHESDVKGNSRDTQVITRTNADGSTQTERHDTTTSSNGSSTETHTVDSTPAKSNSTLPGQEGSKWLSAVSPPRLGDKTIPAGSVKSDPRVVNPNPAGDSLSAGTVDAQAIVQAGLDKVTTPVTGGSGVTIRDLPVLQSTRPVDIRTVNPIPGK